MLRTGRLNDRGSIPGKGKSYFSFPKFPKWFRGLNSIVSYVRRGFFPGVKSARCLLKIPGLLIHYIGSADAKFYIYVRSFIHSFHWHVRNTTIPYRSHELFHSSVLCTFSCHPSPPTILPSSLTSSCHLLSGLPLNLVVPKFMYNTLLGILFSSILCTCPNQCNLFNLIVSVTVGSVTIASIFYWLISSSFLFHCHVLGLNFFYKLSFQICSFAFYRSLLMSRFLMHMLTFFYYCVLWS